MLEKQRWNELSEGNIGLRQAGLAAEISGKKLELEKSSRRPKIAAVAELHFDGPITIEVPVINKTSDIGLPGWASAIISHRYIRATDASARHVQTWCKAVCNTMQRAKASTMPCRPLMPTISRHIRIWKRRENRWHSPTRTMPWCKPL